MSAQLDILWATGNKFFPGWPYSTGSDTDSFWIRLESGEQVVEVHVPKSTPLDVYEETAWMNFKKVRDAYDLELATEAANV